MAGSQKVFLRIVGLMGDGPDADEMPDRVPVSGSGRLVPTIALGSADVAPGPDSLHEIRMVEPIPFEIVDGMLTYDAKPYVWLPVPTGEWMWRITFDRVIVGSHLRELNDFAFPLDEATPAQVADENYPGVNLAQYGIGSWAPGTVNLTAQAIQQITIYLGRASNAAGDAEQSRQAAAAAKSQIDTTHGHIHQDVTHADTHALAAGAASATATTKALEASTSAGVATTKAAEAAQHRADTLGFRNTAQGAATTATTKAGEAAASAQTATTKAAQTAIDALTLAQRVAGGAREIKRTSDGKPYLLPESEVSEVDLRVDTTVGTRVLLGDVMIHGDTGWRDVSTDLATAGWDFSGSPNHGMSIRRIGSMVHLSVRGEFDPASAIYMTNPISSGWRAPGTGKRSYLIWGELHSNDGAVRVGFSHRPFEISVRGLTSKQYLTGKISWINEDGWPNTLLGTAE